MNCSAKPSLQEVCYKLSEALDSLAKHEKKVSQVDQILSEVGSHQKDHTTQVAKVVKDLEETRNAIRTLSSVVTDSLVADQKISKDQVKIQEDIQMIQDRYENTIETVIEKIDVDGLIKVINGHTAALDDLMYHMGPAGLPRSHSLNLAYRVSDLEENTTKTFFCTVLSALAAAVWAGALGASISLYK